MRSVVEVLDAINSNFDAIDQIVAANNERLAGLGQKIDVATKEVSEFAVWITRRPYANGCDPAIKNERGATWPVSDWTSNSVGQRDPHAKTNHTNAHRHHRLHQRAVDRSCVWPG